MNTFPQILWDEVNICFFICLYVLYVCIAVISLFLIKKTHSYTINVTFYWRCTKYSHVNTYTSEVHVYTAELIISYIKILVH